MNFFLSVLALTTMKSLGSITLQLYIHFIFWAQLYLFTNYFGVYIYCFYKKMNWLSYNYIQRPRITYDQWTLAVEIYMREIVREKKMVSRQIPLMHCYTWYMSWWYHSLMATWHRVLFLLLYTLSIFIDQKK